MNYWSSESSGTPNEPDPLHAFDSPHDYTVNYGIGVMPPDDLASMQEPLAPSAFFNDMVGMEEIRQESEWEAQSTSVRAVRVLLFSLTRRDGFPTIPFHAGLLALLTAYPAG
jgi:hypothetical protein